MKQILVYADSLSWGIVPGTRQRLPFDQRWPGVMELQLNALGRSVRVIEDCLNGRRTVWDDPFKPGRNGLQGLAQRIEVNSPLSLVILLLGVNDFQVTRDCNAWQSAQGLGTLISEIRKAPIEPGMPIPEILVVAPPTIQAAKGAIAPKFAGAEIRAQGLNDAIRDIAKAEHCHFFDAAKIIASSSVDGVHLDAPEHMTLGNALAQETARILATAT